ncbi:calcium-binding protein [Nitrosospira sp. Nsp13]|uniref:calcium-binding protein n=1 Tax=Nitrosospira sp. Nsp13 TaxID=1855332 RepID=UPI00089132C3|nr:calcium-binding protein [Nitrosospira sp. Nsp13]SCX82072.1 Hemolysin-type calcium-binding repeat-containing protein [Nitrosospira sp. Nsp13]
MTIVTTTGDSSSLLNAQVGVFDDVAYNTASFFEQTFSYTYLDAYYGSMIIGYSSNTQIQGYSPSANGNLSAEGTNFYGTSGSVKFLAFDNGADNSYWMGSGNGSFRENPYGGIELNGKFNELTISLDNGTNEGLYLKGQFSFDSNFNLIGKFTQETITYGDWSLTYTGNVSIGSSGLTGTIKSIMFSDTAGASIRVQGNFSASTYFAVADSVNTVDELLNLQILLAGSETFNVPDAARAWHGYGGNDKLYGGSLDDELYGDEGNDKLYGYAGSDLLTGGNGNDQIDGGDGNDSINGGEGNDKIIDMSGDNLIVDDIGNANIVLGNGNDVVTTGLGNDKIVAGDGNNTISAGGGNNKVTAGLGDDTITTGAGNDNINAGTGNNTVSAGDGADKISTGFGNDTLNGGNGNDTIIAGGGNDILIGGTGADKLTGGWGGDQFIFDNIAQGGIDKITDFHSSDGDKLVFDVSIFTALSGGITAENLVVGTGTIAIAGDGNDYLILNTRGGKLYYDADGSGLGAAIQIATLTGVTTLEYTDFMII